MDKPLISIGLLTYNHEKYIEDCIKGILSQTYPRMEIIILDDASPDNTCKIIEKYMPQLEKKFERVKFIKNINNCGNVPHNCNVIESEVKGEFYFGASGDDIMLPHCVSRLYENLIKYPECALIHANCIYIDDNFKFGDMPNENNLIKKNKETGIENENFFKQMMIVNRILAPTVLLRFFVLKKYGNHDEDVAFEDYEYFIRISEKERIFYLNEVILLYRRADTSMSYYYAKDGEKKIRTAIEADYKAKKKHINKFTVIEAREIWENYYNQYTYIIKKANCKSLYKELGLLIKQIDYSLYNSYQKRVLRLNYEDIFNLKKENLLLYIKKQLKKGNSSIAIYGFSKVGKLLLEFFLFNNINIKYIIDRKGNTIIAPLPVYLPKETLPNVDAIIVVPYGIFDEVYPLIKDKISSKILDLENILLEML